MHVREKPPLRLQWQAATPAGGKYRWGEDEPDPANVPGGVTFSTTMPGGYEQASLTLPRKPAREYGDLERLTTLTCYGPGGEPAWEGRLERAPRVSGDQMAVSPAAVGWQAHLEDDKSVIVIYVDRDVSHWQGPGTARQAQFANVRFSGMDASPDSTGTPGLWAKWTRIDEASPPTAAQPMDFREAWYDGHGADIAALYYSFDMVANMGANWVNQAHLAGTDTHTSPTLAGTDHVATDTATYLGSSGYTNTGYKWALLHSYYNGAFTGDGNWEAVWKDVTVYGATGLTAVGPNPFGFYASTIVGHAVATWAPLLTTDIQQSQYIIQHAAFLEPTTAGEIIRQVTRYGLQDWAVWDDKTFYWHNRGHRGRSWRGRIAPFQLEQAGESVERLFESVVVQYQDVDGTTRTVGPPGSGANVEDAGLVDADTENPAVRLGITKRALMTMGVAVSADAIEVGTRFLAEQKQLDASGSAQLVGHVEDDRGVLHAAWKVKAGDTIRFVDAADPTPRRIVRTSYDHGSRTCSVDIDAPPEGLQALLERLGADLVTVGL